MTMPRYHARAQVVGGQQAKAFTPPLMWPHQAAALPVVLHPLPLRHDPRDRPLVQPADTNLMPRGTRAHTHTHKLKHTQRHTHRGTHTEVHTQRHTQRHTGTCRGTHTEARTQRHTHRGTQAHAEAHTQRHTDIHTEAHGHTGTGTIAHTGTGTDVHRYTDRSKAGAIIILQWCEQARIWL